MYCAPSTPKVLCDVLDEAQLSGFIELLLLETHPESQRLHFPQIRKAPCSPNHDEER